MGLSRATTVCVVVCLFKEFQLAASYEGLVETVPGVTTLNRLCITLHYITLHYKLHYIHYTR